MATGMSTLRNGMSWWGRAAAGALVSALRLAEPASAAPTVIEAGGLRLTLDERGALASLGRPGGPELLAAGPDAPPLRFGVGVPVANGPAKLLEFGTDRARAVQVDAVTATADGGQTVRVRFAEFAVDGAPEELSRLTAWFTATVAPGEDAVRLRVGAEVPEPLVLEYIQGPPVAVGIAADSRLVTGVAKGGVYADLMGWKEGMTVSASHPGNLAAQFGAVYGPARGVVVYSCDSVGYPKGLIVRRAGPAMQLIWRHACYATGRYEPPYDVVIRPLEAAPPETLTWHHAADLYAEWARAQAWCATRFADRADIPAWMKEGPSLVRFNRPHLARPETVEQWLREYWQPLHGQEIPLIVAFWGWEHVDSWVAPTYLPPYPGEAEFRRIIAAVNAANGHGFLWPSGYHWTVSFGARPDGTFEWDDRKRWEAEGKTHTVVSRDGSLAVSPRSWLRGGQNASLCPGDPWTRAWFDRIALDCLSTGAPMVQVDQVVCGSFPTCFSRVHGHAPGAGPWKAEVFADQMRRLAVACRAASPDGVVGFEEPQELFNHLAGIQDYRDLEVAWGNVPAPEPASVFAYLYHEYLPVFQSNPHGGDLVTQGYCLVNGQIPHLVPSLRFGRGPLVVGGGMDEVGNPGVPAGWDKLAGYKGETWNGACAVDTEMKHSGAASLRLENTGEQTVQVSQNIPIGKTGIVPGVPYRLRAWLRCERLERPNTVNFAALTRALESKGGGRLAFPPADGQWHEVSAPFTVAAGADFLRIMLHVGGAARVWVDDLAILDDATGQVVEAQAGPGDHELTRQWSRLFHGEGRPYLQHGRLLHPPALQADTLAYSGRTVPAILHNAFRAADGSTAVVLVNVTNEERVGTLRWNGQDHTVTLAAQEARLLR
jgi:hypothetical protein